MFQFYHENHHYGKHETVTGKQRFVESDVKQFHASYLQNEVNNNCFIYKNINIFIQ